MAQEGKALDDPLASRLAAVATGNDPDALAARVLAVSEVFGDTGQEPSVREAVTRHLRLILSPDARTAAEALQAVPA